MSDQEVPETDAHIRALLAELGSGPDGEPIPAHVAARLDDTLARLVAERDAPSAATATSTDSDSSTDTSTSTVVPLRRRWLPRITAAAAAVVVLGAGGVAASNLGVFGGGDALTTADSSGAGGARSETAPETAPGTDSSAPAPTGGDDTRLGALATLPEVGSATFAADVQGLADTGTLSARERSALREEATDSAGKAAEDPSLPACPGPAATDGAVPGPVRYDGRLAVLVVHPERDGQQLVEAWDCAGGTRLASTVLTR